MAYLSTWLSPPALRSTADQQEPRVWKQHSGAWVEKPLVRSFSTVNCGASVGWGGEHGQIWALLWVSSGVWLWDFCGTRTNSPHLPSYGSSPGREGCRISIGRWWNGAGLKMCCRTLQRREQLLLSKSLRIKKPCMLPKEKNMYLCVISDRRVCHIVAYHKALVIAKNMDHK